MDQPPPESPTPPPSEGSRDPNARTWAVVCHLSAFAGLIVPFGNIIAPLVVWLLKRHDDPEIELHGKESVNFQISMTIYTLVALLLIFVLIGFILAPLLALLNIILVVIASIKASNGEGYRYPLTIRLVE